MQVVRGFEGQAKASAVYDPFWWPRDLYCWIQAFFLVFKH